MPVTATRPAPPLAAAGVPAPRPRRGRFNKPRRPSQPASEHEILFQKFFKSVGPRTYAAQVKRASNGNHYLVLTEGKRDEKTAELRKTRLFVYGEDFIEFFRLIKSAAEFIKAHPVPADVVSKREKFWKKQSTAPAASPSGVPGSSLTIATDSSRLPSNGIPPRSAGPLAARGVTRSGVADHRSPLANEATHATAAAAVSPRADLRWRAPGGGESGPGKPWPLAGTRFPRSSVS